MFSRDQKKILPHIHYNVNRNKGHEFFVFSCQWNPLPAGFIVLKPSDTNVSTASNKLFNSLLSQSQA